MYRVAMVNDGKREWKCFIYLEDAVKFLRSNYRQLIRCEGCLPQNLVVMAAIDGDGVDIHAMVTIELKTGRRMYYSWYIEDLKEKEKENGR